MWRYIFPIAFLAISALIVLVWLLSGLFLWRGSGSGDSLSSGCMECHSGPRAIELGLKDVYAEFRVLRHRHPAVKEERCEQCHIIKGLRAGRTWELFSHAAQKEQVFFLEDLLLDKKYQIDLTVKDGTGKEISVAPIQIIPLQVTNSVNNDMEPPVIKNVILEEVRQAVFPEATISWETDEPSSSIVEYGLTSRYGERAESEKIFADAHRITITGLRKGEQYHYRIVSRDIFGNAGVSDDFMLDTSRQASKAAGAGILPARVTPRIKEVNVFKISETKDIYLKLLSDRPVKAYLVVKEPVETDSKHGFGLAPAKFSGIDACVGCHTQGISHPVGIRSAGAKTIIPKELPTVEGGVITCVTCHHAHGGSRKYFARLDFERDICIKCHTGGPYL